MAKEFNMNDLKGVCKTLNDEVIGEDEEKIKVVGVKKDALLETFADMVEKYAALAEEGGKPLPENVVEFFNFVFAEDSEEAPPPPPKKTKTEKKEEATKPAKTERKPKEPKPKSIYGHVLGSQAGDLDALFAAEEGCTVAEAAEKLGVKNIRVTGHLAHLVKDKGLKRVQLADDRIRIE